MQKLIIVGCGPKAIAVAAKARVLSELGWSVPEITIIEKNSPAAHWDGSAGYTDGDTILGTTPLEDIGFPYESIIDSSVDKAMLKYSYMAYLIDIGKYAEWVDRHLTPPSHAMLADYLKWVFQKVEMPLTVGEVTNISQTGGRWAVTIAGGKNQTLESDGLVLTGPGEAMSFPRVGSSGGPDRIFNGQNIWQNIGHFKDLKNAKIAVIGGGETAAGAVTGLLKIIDKSSQVEVITRHPILFTRNENWREVMYFSTAMGWDDLSDREKTEVIKHADRGTFSVAAKDLLDTAYNVSTRLGNVKEIEIKDGKLYLNLSENKEKQIGGYDYIVEATGFDPFSFVKLFADESLFAAVKDIPYAIAEDLSLSNVSPKLHLPVLASMAQGPGFPNLSCLGLLAERVLIPYISK